MRGVSAQKQSEHVNDTLGVVLSVIHDVAQARELELAEHDEVSRSVRRHLRSAIAASPLHGSRTRVLALSLRASAVRARQRSNAGFEAEQERDVPLITDPL